MSDPLLHAIVPFDDAHAHQVTEIYNREVELGDSALHMAPLSAGECVQWFGEAGEHFGAFVYTRDGRVCGWVGLIPFDSGSAYNLTAQLIIYVSHRTRREGVGTKLLDQAIAMANERFHSIITLLPSEPAWRLAWLQRRSLQPCGQLVAAVRLRGQWLDLAVLQLVLDRVLAK